MDAHVPALQRLEEACLTQLRLPAQVHHLSRGQVRPSLKENVRPECIKHSRLLLAQSESRQRSELAVRVAQIMTDVSRQRQADLVQIANNLGRLEGLATRDRVQHQQVMDAVARLAQQR